MRSINPIRESCEMMMKNKWQYRKIGDVCVVERGSSPRPIDQFITEDGGGINWIKIGDTTESMYITETAQKIKPEGMKKSRYVEPGDFLLSNSMSFGRPYILKIDGCIHDGWLVLKDKDEIFDKRFLYYYLSSKATYQKFKHMAVGGVVNNLNSEMVRKIDVPVPSKDEQMDTADLLDKICNIISLRKRELNCLDDLIRARFVELFGDENNSKNWSIVHIEDVADVQVGVVIKPSQYYNDESNGIKAFRSLNVGAGFIKDSDWVYFTAEGHQKNSKSILRENDLLIVRSGAPGTACVVTEDYVGCNAIDIIIAHPDCEKVNPYYLCTFTNMPHGKKQIVEGTGGAAQQHFNVGKYNKLQLMLPPKELQDKFVEFINQIAKSKAAVQKALDQTQLLFDSLMQEYFG